jgi:hypothetical protein
MQIARADSNSGIKMSDVAFLKAQVHRMILPIVAP